MQQPSEPIMVHVVEQPVESTSLSDVLVGSIGLTAALLLVALLMGLALGGLLIALKRLRDRNNPKAGPGSDAIHISPYV
jgi:hypothetical protein